MPHCIYIMLWYEPNLWKCLPIGVAFYGMGENSLIVLKEIIINMKRTHELYPQIMLYISRMRCEIYMYEKDLSQNINVNMTRK